jgi:hypothetical protein
MDTPTLIITIVCVLGSGLILAAVAALIVWIVWSRRKRKQEKLAAVRTHGRPGQATVLSRVDQAPNDDGRSDWAIGLEITVPGFSPYRVTKSFELSGQHLRQMQIGSVVQVLADPTQPNNLDRLAIVWPDDGTIYV